MGLQRGNNLLNRMDLHSRRVSSRLRKCKFTISANFRDKSLFKKKNYSRKKTILLFRNEVTNGATIPKFLIKKKRKTTTCFLRLLWTYNFGEPNQLQYARRYLAPELQQNVHRSIMTLAVWWIVLRQLFQIHGPQLNANITIFVNSIEKSQFRSIWSDTYLTQYESMKQRRHVQDRCFRLFREPGECDLHVICNMARDFLRYWLRGWARWPVGVRVIVARVHCGMRERT